MTETTPSPPARPLALEASHVALGARFEARLGYRLPMAYGPSADATAEEYAAAREAAAFERAKIKEIISDVLGKIKATGMAVNEVANKKPFQEAVKPLYTKFEGEIGKDVLDAVMKERDSFK